MGLLPGAGSTLAERGRKSFRSVAPVSARTLPLALICPPLASRDLRSICIGVLAPVSRLRTSGSSPRAQCKGRRAATILETETTSSSSEVVHRRRRQAGPAGLSAVPG